MLKFPILLLIKRIFFNKPVLDTVDVAPNETDPYGTYGTGTFMVSLLTVAALLSGCSTMPIRHPVPRDLVDKAVIGDMSDIRMIAGESNTGFQNNLLLSIRQETAEDFPNGPDGVRTYPLLAISGGGANGAYGAGLLKGWSKEGSRPVFKIVTGISTGAIMAPFAFIGKEYDGELEKFYTTLSTKEIMSSRGIFGPLFSNSLSSNRPLIKVLAKYMGDELLAEVAAGHKRGRRLFVGTANIDAQRLVIWDMGAIACKGDAELFRKVIIASASIPVTFPPVFFQVTAGGRSYDEMHVDGGTLTQVFTTNNLLEHMASAVKSAGIDPLKIKTRLFILLNGYASPHYMDVNDNLSAIAERSIDTIIEAQGVGDTYRIYYYMMEKGGDYNLAYIPPDFKPESKEMFDINEMNRLFKRGYDDAVKGYNWQKSPVFYNTSDRASAEK